MEQTQEKEEMSPLWRWFSDRANSPHALAWLSAISFLEPIFLPLWPESLLTAMILAHGKEWKKFAAIAAVASVLGGIVGYGIGMFLFYHFGPSLLTYFGLHRAFRLAQTALAGNIFIVMLLTTFTPVPDKLFVLLGGFLHVPLFPYVAGFFIGRSCRYFAVSYLVHRYGSHILRGVREYFSILALIVATIFIFALIRMFQTGLL